jgi:hypothetical protein
MAANVHHTAGFGRFLVGNQKRVTLWKKYKNYRISEVHQEIAVFNIRRTVCGHSVSPPIPLYSGYPRLFLLG